MFNKSQLFFIYKTKSVNLFQEMTKRRKRSLYQIIVRDIPYVP